MEEFTWHKYSMTEQQGIWQISNSKQMASTEVVIQEFPDRNAFSVLSQIALMTL